MEFEWDENKRLSNLKKHGLDFADIGYVFEDEQAVSFENISKEFGEHRFITIGCCKNKLCIAVVVYTKRKERIRIISFRKASKAERSLYYGNSTIHN
jgi:uncharacterized DUF497 family protein